MRVYFSFRNVSNFHENELKWVRKLWAKEAKFTFSSLTNFLFFYFSVFFFFFFNMKFQIKSRGKGEHTEISLKRHKIQKHVWRGVPPRLVHGLVRVILFIYKHSYYFFAPICRMYLPVISFHYSCTYPWYWYFVHLLPLGKQH